MNTQEDTRRFFFACSLLLFACATVYKAGNTLVGGKTPDVETPTNPRFRQKHVLDTFLIKWYHHLQLLISNSFSDFFLTIF